MNQYTLRFPTFTEKQLESWAGLDARYQIEIGASRSGKTVVDVVKCINYSHILDNSDDAPPARGLIARWHYRDLEKTVMMTFKQFMPLKKNPLIADFNKSKGIVTFINGSEIHFCGLEQWGHIPGSEYSFIFIDQLEELPAQKLWDDLDARLSLPGAESYHLLATLNPVSSLGWYYDVIEKHRGQPDWSIVKYKMEDNKDNLPEQTYRQMMGKDPLYKRVYFLGEWGDVVSGDPVINSFNYEVSVVKEPLVYIPGVTIDRSWDSGSVCPAMTCGQLLGDTLYIYWSTFPARKQEQPLRNFIRDIKAGCQTRFPDAYFRDICGPEVKHPYRDYEVRPEESPINTDVKLFSAMGIEPLNIVSEHLVDGEARLRDLFNPSEGKTRIMINCVDCDPLISALLGGYCRTKAGLTKDPNPPHKDLIDTLRYLSLFLNMAITGSQKEVLHLNRKPVKPIFDPYTGEVADPAGVSSEPFWME